MTPNPNLPLPAPALYVTFYKNLAQEDGVGSGASKPWRRTKSMPLVREAYDYSPKVNWSEVAEIKEKRRGLGNLGSPTWLNKKRKKK